MRIRYFFLLLLSVFTFNLVVQAKSVSTDNVKNGNADKVGLVFPAQMPTVKDIDNNEYHTIQMGDMVWMAENLKVTHYRNGTKISNVKDAAEWESLTTGAYCEYDNKPENGSKFGRLYNFYAVADERNIAPKGWHVATDEEWTELKNYLVAKGYNFDGSKTGNNIAKALAAPSDWLTSVYSGNPGFEIGKNNATHFNAFPGSFRSMGGAFTYPIGRGANFWTSTESHNASAWNRYLSYDLGHIARDAGEKVFGLSVRCVKGELAVAAKPLSPTVTDIDKNDYSTVQIGKQVWMAENLKVTHYRNGEKIPNVTDASQWESLTSGAYCDYENKVENGEKFGKLYNFYAVADQRNIAPKGWHVATDEEWTTLKNYLIAEGYNFDGSRSGNNIAKSLAAQADWMISVYSGKPGSEIKKNNTSHFNALPGSFRSVGGAFTYPIGRGANFWTATQGQGVYAWNRYLSYDLGHIARDAGQKIFGLSVRCVKD